MFKLYFAFFAAVGLLTTLSVAGQTKTAPKPAARPRAVKTIKAAPKTPAQPKTSDQPAQPVQSAVVTGSLELEAGLIYNSGDVKPVARVPFRLLKNNPAEFLRTPEMFALRQADVKDRDSKSNFPGLDQTTYEEWSLSKLMVELNYAELYPTFSAKAIELLKSGVEAESVTGFDGKAIFENVPAGKYYIFGTTKIGRSITTWIVPAEITAKTQKIVLDNNNMF